VTRAIHKTSRPHGKRNISRTKNISPENYPVNVALSVLNAIAKMGSIVFLPSVNRSSTPKLDSKINPGRYPQGGSPLV
jgi:hypothetical protein